MNKDQKVSNMRLRFEGRREALTHQNSNGGLVSNNYTQGLQDASGSAKDNTIKTGNLHRNNSIRNKVPFGFMDTLEQMGEALTHQNSNGGLVSNNYTQGLQDASGSAKDNTIKTGNLHRNNSIRNKVPFGFMDTLEQRYGAVTHQNSNGGLVSNNYTQGLQDASGSTKDNTIKTSNLHRNNSIRNKMPAEFLDSLARVHGVKEVPKSNNDAVKCSTIQNENTDISNKM